MATQLPALLAVPTRTDTLEPRGIVHSTTVGVLAPGARNATLIFSPSGPLAVTDTLEPLP